MRLGWHTIRDTHNYGALTVSGVIIKSSNVGSAKLHYHFRKKLCRASLIVLVLVSVLQVRFPGESSGLVLPVNKLNSSQIGTMAYGYGLNATILQLAQGYAMLANHGVKCH